MKVVIMAGGKGTRIASVNGDIPKPMIQVCGKPILQHQIECLKGQGCEDFVLVTGYLGHVIKDYFQDGSRFRVGVSYIEEKEPLGTAGALYYLKNDVAEDFLLINGDIIFDVDIRRFYAVHRQNGALATIFTHPNSHPYDSGLIVTEADGRVMGWLNREDERGWHKNCVNAGLHMLSPNILKCFDKPVKRDLDRDVLKPLIERRALSAYQSPEYVKDMGTPDRYCAVCHDIQMGLVKRKNLAVKQKAFFLDRDGTINRHVGFLTNIHDFELLEGAAEAVRLINKHGYLAIVVTNQPVIARGDISLEELQEIHNKMETLLGREGAYVDDIFYCPHHPDRGFPGERLQYKIECGCRKPNPGLILEAAEKYNIDLSQSIMVGDGINDVEAGKRAGCKTAFIGTQKVEGTALYPDLLTCVKQTLEKHSL